MLLGVGVVELLVTHLLLAHWWPRTAAVVSVLTAAGLGWFVWGLLGMGGLPVLVTPRAVVMRAGRLKRVDLPRERIRDVLFDTGGAGLGGRDPAVFNLALLASPNVLVRLTEPMRVGRRRIEAIGHRLDDPAGFAAALGRPC